MPNIVITGCSKEKIETSEPIPAIELYQGGFVPRLRAYIPQTLYSHMFILSAKHGLLHSSDRISTYDQPLSFDRAKELRPTVWTDVQSRILEPFRPEEILIVVEPPYLILIADIFALPHSPRVYWEPDIREHSPLVEEVLRSWGWVA